MSDASNQPPSSDNIYPIMHAALEECLLHAKQLHSVLLDEKAILIAREFDKLNDISQAKQSLSDHLRQTSTHIRESLFQNDVPNPMFKQLSDSQQSTINQLNQKFQNLMLSCQKQNHVNGQVIAVNLNNNKELLNILKGNDALSGLYSASGAIESPSNEFKNHKEV